MSISDFSLSSPRKSANLDREKSSYDEDFERFLNDVNNFSFLFFF
jgi:hypothetical protein